MILIAPTAFKGTIGARAAAAAMADGVRTLGVADVIELPLSDGGPGLIDAIGSGKDRIEMVTVDGPLGDRVEARLLWRGKTAILETADACGLHLVPATRRDPLRATTRGVGQLVAAAIERNASEIVLGLGGSATVDGGIGMAAALGWRFLDHNDQPLEPLPDSLERLARIEPPEPRVQVRCIALADVKTPLVGPEGAARVFGPQKGASPEAVKRLDRRLSHLATIVARDLGVEIASTPGGGAAGGLGAAIRAFLDGQIISGSAWVLEQVGFDDLIGHTRLVVTGEGGFDAQSSLGKVTGVVIERAIAAAVPVVLIAGIVSGLIPAGVRVASRNGATLSKDDLRALTREACARLLPL